MEVTKNIPLPKKSTGGRPLKYPFNTMCIGESFSFGGDKLAYQSVRSAANKYGKKHGMKFVTRFHDGLITVWRDKIKKKK
jgi:hypothetical protein